MGELLYSFFIGDPEDKPDCPPIQTLQHITFQEAGDQWLIYSGGYHTPSEGSNASHVLSIYSTNNKNFKPLEPFGSGIVDFMYLPSMRC